MNEPTKLEQAILDWLAQREAAGETEAHGYLLGKGAQEVMVSKRLPAHGTLYNALDRMERNGLLVSRWEDAAEAEAARRPRRRLYRRTPLRHADEQGGEG